MLLLLPGLFCQAVPVQVSQNPDGSYHLLRGNHPYYIMGAGGDGSKELLAASGANTFRTWGIESDFGQQLDQASDSGLTVIAGHWLGHERHGFNYSDTLKLKDQYDRVRRDVITYKDHPALLIWGIGNETEGIGEGDNPKIWNHIQDIAAMIKQVDPDHPTMVVIAEVGGKKVEMINKLCPDIDIIGINSYGGMPTLPERYRKAGGVKPYIVTEFGPPGVWESAKTEFGAPLELTSTQKATLYKDFFQKGCLAAADLCLGGCAFIWGSKTETTATWFGMLLPDGSKLAAVDAMTEIWSGKPPDDLCPEINKIELAGSNILQSGDKVRVDLDAYDPEGDDLSVQWMFCTEAPEYLTFGESWWQPLELGDVIVNSTAKSVELIMPGGGIYRLYAVVHDGKGNAATANVPLKVEGEPTVVQLKLPLAVYADDSPQPWVPSGWMGDYNALSLDFKSSDFPHSGDTCLEIYYRPSSSWVGVAWQNPVNDWGELPGGFDLTGAEKLTFWARGRFGGETVDFGVGLLGSDTKYPDTLSAKLEGVKLKKHWKQYKIDLKGKNLSRVKTPFYWVMSGSSHSNTFYLDDIHFE